MDKYRGSDLERDGQIEVSWWIGSDDRRRVLLHQKMFGRKVVSRGRTHYYDGLFMVWREVSGVVRRLRAVDFTVLGRSHMIIPKDLQPRLERTFSEIEVDHRWHPYIPNKNVLVRF